MTTGGIFSKYIHVREYDEGSKNSGVRLEATKNVASMNDEAHHKLVWGWLRLVLGFLQMGLVAAALGSLITAGLHWITWLFVVGATAATVTSRLIYHGRPDPTLKRREHE